MTAMNATSPKGDAIDFSELKAAGLLPSPKGVMLAVLRLCQCEQVGLPELARTIGATPVLAGRVIKMANALRPVRHRPLAAVTTDVLILVGVHAIRQLVLGVGLIDSSRSGYCAAFDYERFWLRSVAMACAAQELGATGRVAPAAELFTCGLLAGVGRLALASARPQSYSRLLAQTEGCTAEQLAAAEAELFVFNHLTLSAAMMADWNIPRLFFEAVALHETPQKCTAAEGSRQLSLVRLLHAAGLIADFCVADAAARQVLMSSISGAVASLGMDGEQAEELLARVEDIWQDWGGALNLKIDPPRPG